MTPRLTFLLAWEAAKESLARFNPLSETQKTRERLHRAWSVGAGFIDQATKWFVIVAVFVFLRDLPDKQISDAWGTIYRSSGQGGDGGRTSALEILNCYWEDLSHVDLSKARLHGLELRGSKVVRVDFTYGFLEDADLSESNLYQAQMKGATLVNANFNHSSLKEVCMEEANIFGATFDGACLDGTSFLGVINAKTEQFADAYWTDRTKFPDSVDISRLNRKKAKECPEGFAHGTMLQDLEKRTFYGRGFPGSYWHCIVLR